MRMAEPSVGYRAPKSQLQWFESRPYNGASLNKSNLKTSLKIGTNTECKGAKIALAPQGHQSTTLWGRNSQVLKMSGAMSEISHGCTPRSRSKLRLGFEEVLKVALRPYLQLLYL